MVDMEINNVFLNIHCPIPGSGTPKVTTSVITLDV